MVSFFVRDIFLFSIQGTEEYVASFFASELGRVEANERTVTEAHLGKVLRK